MCIENFNEQILIEVFGMVLNKLTMKITSPGQYKWQQVEKKIMYGVPAYFLNSAIYLPACLMSHTGVLSASAGRWLLLRLEFISQAVHRSGIQ